MCFLCFSSRFLYCSSYGGVGTRSCGGVFGKKYPPAASKILARCPTLLRFFPCIRAFFTQKTASQAEYLHPLPAFCGRFSGALRGVPPVLLIKRAKGRLKRVSDGLVLHVVSGRRGVAAAARPIGVEKRAARFVGALAEVVALCLQQVGGQPLGGVAVQKGNRGGHTRHGDT